MLVSVVRVVGVQLYIIGLIGVSWNLFSLIDNTIVSII